MLSSVSKTVVSHRKSPQTVDFAKAGYKNVLQRLRYHSKGFATSQILCDWISLNELENVLDYLSVKAFVSKYGHHFSFL